MKCEPLPGPKKRGEARSPNRERALEGAEITLKRKPEKESSLHVCSKYIVTEKVTQVSGVNLTIIIVHFQAKPFYYLSRFF